MLETKGPPRQSLGPFAKGWGQAQVFKQFIQKAGLTDIPPCEPVVKAGSLLNRSLCRAVADVLASPALPF